MSDSTSTVRSVVSEAEWEQRVDLAACYRLVALFGWDDLIFTHISARVPGPEHHFLINPYGMLFSEITASALVKVDLEGRKVTDSPYEINPACCAQGRQVRASRAQFRRCRGFGSSARRTADLAAFHIRVVVTRLPRLRGIGAQRRRKAEAGA